MTCPKCGSLNIAGAPDEAPPWATQWTKCFACGKRWNLEGGQPKTTGEDDDTEELDVSTSPKRTGEDIVKLVMDLSRQSKPGPKAGPIDTKEMTMRPRCTKGSCEDESAEDSVRCPKHRDLQRAQNAKFQGRAVSHAPTVDPVKLKRKYTRRIPLGGGYGGGHFTGEAFECADRAGRASDHQSAGERERTESGGAGDRPTHCNLRG